MKKQFNFETADNEALANYAEQICKWYPDKAESLAFYLQAALQDRDAVTMKPLDDWTKINGTHKQGGFIMPYSVLVDALGEPHQRFTPETGDKVDVEWAFEFGNGDVVTVYNWKNGKVYLGDDGYEPHQMTEWHVGGLFQSVLHSLTEEINNRLEAKEGIK